MARLSRRLAPLAGCGWFNALQIRGERRAPRVLTPRALGVGRRRGPFSGALLLNMSTPVFPGIQCGKAKAVPRARARADASLLLPRGEDPQVRTTFENRTAQSRPATTMEQTICQPFFARSRVRDLTSQRLGIGAGPVSTPLFVKKDWDNCEAAGREFLKKSSAVVFLSQDGR
jgi:hypothetical protein